MTAPATGQWRPDEQAAEMVEVLQGATRMLAGVALRSLDVLEGAVSLPQFRVLALLGELGPTRSTRVARALGLDASSVTRLADRLVAAGHVVRGGDPDNRKLVTLDLTGTGRALVFEVAQWRRQELTRILGLLESGERDTLTAALRRLTEVAGDGYGIIARSPVPLLRPDLGHRSVIRSSRSITSSGFLTDGVRTRVPSIGVTPPISRARRR